MNKTIGKIKEVKLCNFKGYRTSDMVPEIISLDADLILVTGKNGVGKTSLLEAIDWFLNQSEVKGGAFLTSGEKNGSISINGEKRKISGTSKTSKNGLNTVASFFFQENLSELACDDIIQLLEPENLPASEIRFGLKDLQLKIEDWQRKLDKYRFRRNYHEERKYFAAEVGELVRKLSGESLLISQLKNSSLVLKNGNLQSRWESQIRKLFETARKYHDRSVPVRASLTHQLEYIASSVTADAGLTPRNSNIDSVKQSVNEKIILALAELPFDTQITRLEGENGFSISLPSEGISLASNSELNDELLGNLERYEAELRNRYTLLLGLKETLDGDELSALEWIDTFIANSSRWLEAWEDHAMQKNMADATSRLHNLLGEYRAASVSRISELVGAIRGLEVDSQIIVSKIDFFYHARRLLTHLNESVEVRNIFVENTEFSVTELSRLLQFVKSDSSEISFSKSNLNDDTEILRKLSDSFSNWASIEFESMSDERKTDKRDGFESAEILLKNAAAICKQEAGSKSQLLSLVGTIPKTELHLLVKNLNDLLAYFHFPKDFLPITLENAGTEKNQQWGFKTKSNVRFKDLSTGQKSQLAICWTINLNLAIADQLGHRVIGFDDFTTSFDLNQIIPAAVLLRKLAYADTESSWKRQVIVTSHHEDITNQLLDLLLPPSGKSMKVIQFQDWSVSDGPKWESFDVDMGQVEQVDLKAAITSAMTT